MRMNTEIPTLALRPSATWGDLLENVLVQESRLAATTREYVCRIRGSSVLSLRRLFTEQVRQLDRWLGRIAERVRGVVATQPAVTPTEAGSPGNDAAPREAVNALLARHEVIIVELRAAVEAVGDRGGDEVAALLSQLLEFHETSAWMLRLLLESPERARVI